MRLNIPSQIMRKKLEPLLKDEPGTFSHLPTVVSGLSQLQHFKRATIACPDFTTNLNEANQWVRAGSLVFGRNSNHEKVSTSSRPTLRNGPKKISGSKSFPVEREYRIHIFDGQLIHQS